MLQVAVALVPKKLYTMKVDTQVDGVKMINGHLGEFYFRGFKISISEIGKAA